VTLIETIQVKKDKVIPESNQENSHRISVPNRHGGGRGPRFSPTKASQRPIRSESPTIRIHDRTTPHEGSNRHLASGKTGGNEGASNNLFNQMLLFYF
jgi:hypothetical protein